MNADCWEMENLCLDPLGNGGGGLEVDPGNVEEDEREIQAQNDHFHDALEEQCKRVIFALENRTTFAVTADPNHQQSNPFSFSFRNTHYFVEEAVAAHYVAESNCDDVNVVMEIDTQSMANISSLLEQFRTILISDSFHLGLDPLSVELHLDQHQNEYGIRFRFYNGSTRVSIRVAPADVGFGPV